MVVAIFQILWEVGGDDEEQLSGLFSCSHAGFHSPNSEPRASSPTIVVLSS
jgi:hypothetical protein